MSIKAEALQIRAKQMLMVCANTFTPAGQLSLEGFSIQRGAKLSRKVWAEFRPPVLPEEAYVPLVDFESVMYIWVPCRFMLA